MSPPPHVPVQRAFEELAGLALADHTLDSLMAEVAGLALRTVPGADEVSVTLVQAGRATTAAATGPCALALDERQYERGFGPCLDCIVGGAPIRIDSTATDPRWPDFCAAARRQGVASSLSIPVPLQREVSAAVNLYGTVPSAFDDATVELARTLAAHAGVALANMHLYEAQSRVAEQLQTAMASRAVIEQAKGILMGSRGCSAEDAFSVLVRVSQDTNRKLRDVAQALVDEARTSGRR